MTDEHPRRHVMPPHGVPFARTVTVGDTTGRLCPVCNTVIPEYYDGDGETLTNNYAEHFESAARGGDDA